MAKPVSKSDLLFAVLGLVGVSTIVLPFFDSPLGSISPLAMLLFMISGVVPTEALWLAGTVLALFLTVLISAISLRLAVFGHLSRTESVCAWLGTAWAACAPTILIAGAAFQKTSLLATSREVTGVSIAQTTIIIGAAAIAWSRSRREVAPARLSVMAMQFAYVADALLYLVLIPREEWAVGAYLALTTVFIYLAHIGTALWHASGRRAKITTGEVPSMTGGST